MFVCVFFFCESTLAYSSLLTDGVVYTTLQATCTSGGDCFSVWSTLWQTMSDLCQAEQKVSKEENQVISKMIVVYFVDNHCDQPFKN